MTINKIYHQLKRLLKQKKFSIPLVVVLILLGVYFYQTRQNGNGDVAVAALGTITEEITVSGTVKPSSEVELAFETSGKVAQVPAGVGTVVRAGQLIVALDQAELLASLAESRANLAAEEAGLLEIKQNSASGGSVSSTRVKSAEVAVKEAELNLIDKINDAYTRADDAVYNTADQFFSGPTSQSATLTIPIGDQDLRGKVGVGRINLEYILQDWQKKVTDSNNTLTADLASTNLQAVKNFLADLALAVNSLVPSNTSEETTFAGYRSDVFAARTSVNTAITNLAAAREKYTSALANLEVEKGDVRGQLARVEQARAQVLSTQAQLAKRVIVAPFDGVVTKQEAKVGAIAGAGTVVATMISSGNLEVEAFVPEVYIGKIAVTNTVEVTLDAFPGEVFSGRVIEVDPAETIVGGVPNYKIKVIIEKNDPRLKTGLTATVIVEAAKKDNVLTIPRFALETKDGKTFVNKLENGEVISVPITVGLVGTDGMVEVTSGLMSGDKVQVGAEPQE